MKRMWSLLLLSWLVVGCEGNTISNCGYACERAHLSMLRYNQTEGCVCKEKPTCPDK